MTSSSLGRFGRGLRPGAHAAGCGHLKMTDLRGEFLFHSLANDGAETGYHKAETAKSVSRPGVSNTMPPINTSSPSINSAVGTRPAAVSACILARIE